MKVEWLAKNLSEKIGSKMHLAGIVLFSILVLSSEGLSSDAHQLSGTVKNEDGEVSADVSLGSKTQTIPSKGYSLLASDEAKEWEAKRNPSSHAAQFLAKSDEENLEDPSEETSQGNVGRKSRHVSTKQPDKINAERSKDGTAETLDEGSSSSQTQEVLPEGSKQEGTSKPGGLAPDATKGSSKKLNHQTKKKMSSSVKSEKTEHVSTKANSFFNFPDWGVEEFDYFINPIIGFASQRLDYPGYSRYFAVAEIGAQIGLSGIPIIEGNPGLTMASSVGSTLGSYKVAEGKNLDWKGSSSNYRRTFGDATFSIFRGFFKDEIRLSRGLISYSNPEWKKSNLQSAGLSNDAGWRLNSALSVHYQLGIEKAWRDKFSDPSLTEWDHWIYGRLKFSPLKFRSDFGPGYQTITQKSSADIFVSDTSQQVSTDVQTSVSMPYLKLALQINPFWKLVAVSSSKWNLASKTSISSPAGQRLPQESIYDTKEVGLPGDSLTSGNFIGLAQLFGGLSVGYQVNLTITDMSDASEKKTNRTSGVALSYQVSL